MIEGIKNGLADIAAGMRPISAAHLSGFDRDAIIEDSPVTTKVGFAGHEGVKIRTIGPA